MDGADGSRAYRLHLPHGVGATHALLCTQLLGGHAASCECNQALCTMLLMHKLFTVLVFGSECRWLLKPVGAVSGRCSKKPPADARNRAALATRFSALVRRD